jgi:AraC-like DNA-binding protein
MSPKTEQCSAITTYREFPVSAHLADYFVCFWKQEIGSEQYAHRVLPDACVDIVFVNDDPPVVVGPWTNSFVAHFPPGTKIVGARLYPGCASSFLHMPATELLNQSVPLTNVLSANRPRFARLLDVANAKSQGGLPFASFAKGGPLLRATTLAAKPDDMVLASIQWLARHPRGRVEQLSQWLGLSRRQLQRRFSIAVGYGPKTFQSVLRFQRLLHFAGGHYNPQSLAGLAAAAGYADQAHMTRHARRFADSTPAILLQSAQSTLRMSDLFKT